MPDFMVRSIKKFIFLGMMTDLTCQNVEKIQKKLTAELTERRVRRAHREM